MFLEVVLFRSLFRNTKSELAGSKKLVTGGNKYLWLAAMAFHFSVLVIVLRHMRFFAEPVPAFAMFLQGLDGFFQVGVPEWYMTNLIIMAALLFLLMRRLYNPQIRLLSHSSDYFPLLLILSVVLSGILMRYFTKTDLLSIKTLAMSWVSFRGVDGEVLRSIGLPFYAHLFLVSALLIYLPFSKITHMAGIFMSPTRNLANNNRMKRHVNPWDYPVKVHTYEEWEEDFRDKMEEAGYEMERETENV